MYRSTPESPHFVRSACADQTEARAARLSDPLAIMSLPDPLRQAAACLRGLGDDFANSVILLIGLKDRLAQGWFHLTLLSQFKSGRGAPPAAHGGSVRRWRLIRPPWPSRRHGPRWRMRPAAGQEPAMELLHLADIAVTDVRAALDLITNPLRLKATMRD